MFKLFLFFLQLVIKITPKLIPDVCTCDAKKNKEGKAKDAKRTQFTLANSNQFLRTSMERHEG